MTLEQTKQDLAATFHRALTTKDWALLRTIMSEDVTWVLPGTNHISGTAEGSTGSSHAPN
ncbi:MAG: hypothetical protein ACRDRL_10905 [Sciscionella sp.]